MSRDKAKAEARKTLRVSISRTGNQWLARIANLSALGHSARTARRLIAAKIEERFGHALFDVEIALPAAFAALVKKYRHDEQLLRELAHSVPELRLRCISELSALNLSQDEVADLMGITRSHVAVTLKRAQSELRTGVRRARQRRGT